MSVGRSSAPEGNRCVPAPYFRLPLATHAPTYRRRRYDEIGQQTPCDLDAADRRRDEQFANRHFSKTAPNPAASNHQSPGLATDFGAAPNKTTPESSRIATEGSSRAYRVDLASFGVTSARNAGSCRSFSTRSIVPNSWIVGVSVERAPNARRANREGRIGRIQSGILVTVVHPLDVARHALVVRGVVNELTPSF